jgi:hypothetical protein
MAYVLFSTDILAVAGGIFNIALNRYPVEFNSVKRNANVNVNRSVNVNVNNSSVVPAAILGNDDNQCRRKSATMTRGGFTNVTLASIPRTISFSLSATAGQKEPPYWAATAEAGVAAGLGAGVIPRYLSYQANQRS